MKILISTGDHSGDLMGALIVENLRKLSNEIEILAIGGEKLKAAGVDLLADSSDWSAIGLFDSVKKIPKVYRSYFKIKKKLAGVRLDGVLYIDCPAFNVRFARTLAPKKLRSIYFFPPSGWKKDLKAAARIGKWVNLVIAPFQNTAELYVAAGVPTFFSGHPLLDLAVPQPDGKKLLREFNVDPRNPVIGLFPGSRDQEIAYILPLILDAVARIREEMRHVQFILPVANKRLEEPIKKEITARKLPIHARADINYKVLQLADFLIVASGTTTLEAALFEKPMLIVYRLSPWTWKFERPFLKGVRFAGLPNLLAEKEIVPELLQEKATPERIAAETTRLIRNEEARWQMAENLRNLRPKLGEPGAIGRVAKIALETFSG